jgi:ubiquinone biosynthesis protein COQ4
LSAVLLDISKRPLRFEKVASPILTQKLQFSSSAAGTKKDKVPFYGRPAPPSSSEASSLNFLQRVTVALHSATTALADPERGDAVAALGDVTGHMALMNLHDIMKKDETGRLILQDRPLIHNAAFDFDELEKKPGTFGHAYATFMKGHGFDPDGRSQVRFVQDPDLAYVMLRYRQVSQNLHKVLHEMKKV